MGWSGWQDLNLRRLHPKCSALPNWATSRYTTYWWREQYFTIVLVPRPQSALTSPISSSPHCSILLLIIQYVTVLLRPSAGCVSRNRYFINPKGVGCLVIVICRTHSTHKLDILFAFLQPRYQALVVVQTGIEPVTSALSEPRSNQLSYWTIYSRRELFKHS